MGYVVYVKTRGTRRTAETFTRVGFVSVGNAVYYDSDRWASPDGFLRQTLYYYSEESGDYYEVSTGHIRGLVEQTEAIGTSGGRTFKSCGQLIEW